MSLTEKLKSLKLKGDAMVTLNYRAGTDVFVHNETEVETAISETDVVSTFAELIATTGLNVSTKWNGNILQSLRAEGYLEDYERGSFAFEEYIVDVLTENFYDQEFIDHSTEKYDHKRGFCTLSTEVQIPVSDIIAKSPYLNNWEMSVQTDDGTLILNS
jgi:hypothetical protein|tara:strand:- start:160 stop:636 length:477 start_codon:yes stop_codon:yes gene_type:complete